MEQLNSFLAAASGYVWGIPLLVLLVGTGIFLTVGRKGDEKRGRIYFKRRQNPSSQ